MNKYSPKLNKGINVLTAISSLAVVVTMLYWIFIFDPSNISIIIQYLIFQVLLVLLVLIFSKGFVNLKLSLFSFNIISIVGGLILIIFTDILVKPLPIENYFKDSGFKSSGFIITEKLFESNNIRGYKLIGSDKSCRNFKMTNNIVEYDVMVNINNIGVSSHFNYLKAKLDTVKRYIVFGDSFSAGMFMDSSWVDKIQANFKQKNVHIELYNFSVDGGGIMNWYSIFCNEIIPDYDFDGIIIMSYLDNLRRPFFYVEAEKDEIYGTYQPHIPPLKSFNENKMALYVISDQKEIESYIKSIDENKFIYSAEDVYIEEQHISVQKDFIMGNPFVKADSIEAFNYLIGEDQLFCLEEIINYCNNNNKDVILAAAPDKVAIKYFKKNETLAFNKQFNLISTHFNVPYFNTYNVFAKLNDEELKQLWFPYDYHWNQKGSNYFAKHFEPFLLSRAFKD